MRWVGGGRSVRTLVRPVFRIRQSGWNGVYGNGRRSAARYVTGTRPVPETIRNARVLVRIDAPDGRAARTAYLFKYLRHDPARPSVAANVGGEVVVGCREKVFAKGLSGLDGCAETKYGTRRRKRQGVIVNKRVENVFCKSSSWVQYILQE